MASVFFSWNQDLQTSIASMDEQHKRLVDLLNNLYAAFVEKRHHAVMGSLLEELIDYTHYHFIDEQKLWEGTEYPDAELHLKEHDDFVKKVTVFYADFKNEKISLTFDVMLFLQKWLKDHIKVTDQDLAKWLNR